MCLVFNIFTSVQLLSCIRLYATAWSAACQAFLSITSSHSLLFYFEIIPGSQDVANIVQNEFMYFITIDYSQKQEINIDTMCIYTYIFSCHLTRVDFCTFIIAVNPLQPKQERYGMFHPHTDLLHQSTHLTPIFITSGNH